jgi:hypothetical protein
MLNKPVCVLGILIGGLVAMALAQQSFAQESPKITVSCTLGTPQPTVNAPVLLNVMIHNGLAEPIVVRTAVNSHGYGAFHARITRPAGEMDDAPQPRPDEAVSGSAVTVGPSETTSTVVLVNKWFDFDREGKYILEVELAEPPMTVAGTRMPKPQAGRLSIEVAPRDPVVLHRICAELEEKITSAPLSSSYELAEVLAHVKDPVAVPFLARLMEKDDKMAGVLAGGLERIGDASAIDTLLRYASDVSEDRRESVRTSLARIAANSSDAVLVRKITDSLR